MNGLRVVVAILVSLLFSIPSFSQSSNGTVSGSVNDPSGAIVPGVTITATNNATGVTSTAISNEAGVYNISGLLPGVYKVSSSLTGFRPQTFTDVQVGNAAQIRLNFALTLGAGAQTVEVTIEAQNLITSSSSSV
ncbi:MAG TPA: carboxypeptidase-like regulatory domain-containing protein, partial [Terriglobia bacterium]|nr:carboxypeptidase-like regulatory domain-containing protein [Terriglobia bacterium]